jgi:hypothetical protein
MFNFSTKTLGLIGGAILFSGMSFAQVCGGSPQAAGVSLTLNVPPILERYEDTTALVSDIVLSCPAGTAATGALVSTMSQNVTSKPLTSGGVALSEATLQIIQAGAVVNAYLGSVTGAQVTFSNVAFPAAAYTIRISNIRVNASAAGSGSVNVPITENLFVTNQGVAVFATPTPVIVGYVETGFATPALTTGVAVKNYVICTANPVTTATTSFSATVKETFGGAFKAATSAGTCGVAPCTVTNGEGGSYTGGIGAGGATTVTGLGTATHGTRFELKFGNVPAGATIWLPTVITNGPLTVTLGTAATGAISPATANPPSGTSTIPAGDYGFTATSGTASVYYDVTATDNTVLGESFDILGYVTAAANFVSTSQPAITLSIAPAPLTPSTDIPTFNATPTVLTVSAFNICQTNLLFTYVTNQVGFETGIAISNTALDPYATASSAKGTPGSCTLSLYGPGAPTATKIATPSGFPTTLDVGNTGTFLLSSVPGIATTGFSGYMIAQCNFLYAHGFAFIADALGNSNGTTMGYIANVLPAVRSGIGATPEALLQ